MSDQNQPYPKQKNLYPEYENTDQAKAAARAQLPITDENTLHSVLMGYHNGLIQELLDGRE